MVYDPLSHAENLRRKLHPKGKTKAKRKEKPKMYWKVDLPPPRKFAISAYRDFQPYKRNLDPQRVKNMF